MDEYYVEQIIAKNPTAKDKMIKVGAWLVSALLIFVGIFMIGSMALALLGIAGCIASFILMPMLNLEYEYLYLEKELSIDKIFNKERRKKAVNIPLDKMEVMARKNSHALDSYMGKLSKSYDFTSCGDDNGVYTIIINDGGLKAYMIEPDEKMIKAIRDHFPRKVTEV